MAVDRIVGLNLPCKNDVLLLRGHLEGVVGMPPAKHAGQDLNEAGVGLHEVVVDQPSAMHAHLQHSACTHGLVQQSSYTVRSCGSMHTLKACCRNTHSRCALVFTH